MAHLGRRSRHRRAVRDPRRRRPRDRRRRSAPALRSPVPRRRPAPTSRRSHEDARPARGMRRGARAVAQPHRGTGNGSGTAASNSSPSPSRPRATRSTACCGTWSTSVGRADRRRRSRWCAVIPPQPGWPVALDYGHPLRRRRGRADASRTPCATSAASRVPFGVGAHPYLRAGDAADRRLRAHAWPRATVIPLDGGLPHRRRRRPWTAASSTSAQVVGLQGARRWTRRSAAAVPAEGDDPRPAPGSTAPDGSTGAVGRSGVRLGAGVHPAGPWWAGAARWPWSR